MLSFKVAPRDLIQYPVVIDVVLWVKPSQHLNRALRRLFGRQLELFFVEVVRLEELDELALVLAQRVKRDEVQDATRADKVQDVSLTGQPVVRLFD